MKKAKTVVEHIRKPAKAGVKRNEAKATKKTCSRGHVFVGPGPCPVCWPGSLKKRRSSI